MIMAAIANPAFCAEFSIRVAKKAQPVLTREREPPIIFASSTGARRRRLLEVLAQCGVLALQTVALRAELRVFLREFVHLGSEVGQTRLKLLQVSQKLLLNHETLEGALRSFVGRVLATGDGALALGESLFAFRAAR